MSKYEKLWNYVVNEDKDLLKLSFGEIEKILSFKIDHAFLQYKKELLEYNYMVKKISLKDEYVLFIKADKQKGD